MAQAGGDDADQDLALFRAVQIDFLDFQRGLALRRWRRGFS